MGSERPPQPVTNKRLFAAVDLPESVTQLLGGLDPGLRGVRWTPSDKMHLTLGFFGSVTPELEQALQEKLCAIKFGAFFLPVTGLGTFPPKGVPRVIWIGVGTAHPHLFQIHKRVQEAALAVGLEPDLRPWHPHITLARCGETPLQKLRKFMQQNADFDAGMFRVEALYLYSSKLTPAGSVYTRELTVSADR
jgi:2'-5' RNA ligase